MLLLPFPWVTQYKLLQMGFPSWSLCCFNNGSFSAQGKKYSVKKLGIGSHPVPVSAHVSACVWGGRGVFLSPQRRFQNVLLRQAGQRPSASPSPRQRNLFRYHLGMFIEYLLCAMPELSARGHSGLLGPVLPTPTFQKGVK